MMKQDGMNKVMSKASVSPSIDLDLPSGAYQCNFNVSYEYAKTHSAEQIEKLLAMQIKRIAGDLKRKASNGET